VWFHPQWQVVQQRLDVVFKPLRVASAQALVQTLCISAENRRAYLYRAVANVKAVANVFFFFFEMRNG